MKSGKARYQEMVRKALEFARSQPEGQVTVARVAAFCGCSANHLLRIFRLVTGTGVLQNLRHIRLEKAKDLLRHSSLNVTEVALAAGFSTHSAFTNVFRRATGATPSEFRKRRQEETSKPAPAAGPRPERTALVLQDDFATGRLAGHWTPARGKWAIADGCLSGSGEGVMLHLETPLPEDFRMDFELRIVCPTWAAATITLQDEKALEPYCSIELPKREGQGVFKLGVRDMLANPEAVLEPDVWQALRLELSDNRFSVWLNDKNVFAFRDIFPPNYSRRNRIAIGSYPAMLSVRRVRLYELESAPVVPAVRQGDALYNAGLFQQARDFYLRHLRPDLPPDEEMELRFKIALCLLHEGKPTDCRGWMNGILHRTRNPFWLRECNLLLLQLDANLGETAPFNAHARSLLRDPLLWDGIRPIVADYYRRLRAAGFLDRALRVAAISVTMEKGRPDADFRARTRVANILKNTRRFKPAERILRPFARLSPLITVLPHARPEALINLYDMHLMRGDAAEARRTLALLPPLIHGEGSQAWLDLQEALCLRTERKFREAMAAFLAIRPRHPSEKSYCASAEVQAAELLYCLGNVEEARRLVRRVAAESPDMPFPAADVFRGFVLLSYLQPLRTDRPAASVLCSGPGAPSPARRGLPAEAEPRFALRGDELAELLLAKARKDDGELSRHGQEMVEAGIVLELGGKPEEAQAVWGEASRRFPPEHCCFWGSLAKAFGAGSPRSERGKPDLSRHSFRAKPDVSRRSFRAKPDVSRRSFQTKPDVSRHSFRAKPDHLETMNLFWTVRSEIFCLAGLLYEHRGETKRPAVDRYRAHCRARARRLFTLSIKEDPTLRWPALLSLSRSESGTLSTAG